MDHAEVPDSIWQLRSSLCKECFCGINKKDPCSVCPKNKWPQFLCDDPFTPAIKNKNSVSPPSIKEMVKSATKSAKIWASRGFQHTDKKTLKIRIETCNKCEFWNSKAIGGTGRCMKCGCSTWAKLRMATEKCPIGKW